MQFMSVSLPCLRIIVSKSPCSDECFVSTDSGRSVTTETHWFSGSAILIVSRIFLSVKSLLLVLTMYDVTI